MAEIAEFDFTHKRGDAFDEAWTIDDQGSDGNTPFDFTGTTVRIHWVSAYDTEPVAKFALSGAGGTLDVLGAPGGAVAVGGLTITPGEIVIPMQVLDGELSKLIDAGTYFYDVELTLPNTQPETWIEGRITVTKDATV